MIELLKVLREESADAGVGPIAVRIPDSVREAIGRRLSHLSEHTNDVLAVASVLGRQFNATEVAAVADQRFEGVLESLQEAAHTGLIEPGGEGADRYRFTHALIREVLHDELPALERLKLHGRAGDALAEIHRADLEPVLTATGSAFENGMEWDREIVHLNKIEELTSDLAPDFTMFQAGDLALSSRDRNLIMVVDASVSRVKWWQIGPWIRQHDPEWAMPEGDFVPKLANGIVAFEMPIDRLEGKFKLSQNRPEADRRRAGGTLAERRDERRVTALRIGRVGPRG